MATIDLDRVAKYELDGRLRVQAHPSVPLFIANYTNKCAFDRSWDDLTLMCRGLIFDADGNIVARPFKKFFNIGEPVAPGAPPPPVPNESFTATEKIDGSLGILYRVDGRPYIATRGSFTSEQAGRANAILHKQKWGKRNGVTVTPPFNPAHTYLFEIVYPENQIVVDYKGMEDLVLLAIIDTETGRELPFEAEPELRNWFPIVQTVGEGCCLGCVADIEHRLVRDEMSNREGLVLRFTSSETRLKVKHPEYVRLHKILTGINDRHIWEMLATNQSFDSLLDRVPDEFFRWVEETRDALLSAHAELSWLVRRVYDAIIAELEPLRRQLHDCSLETSMAVKREYRKQFARLASENKYSALLFVLFDGGDPSAAIWQMLRPTEVERPSASAE